MQAAAPRFLAYCSSLRALLFAAAHSLTRLINAHLHVRWPPSSRLCRQAVQWRHAVDPPPAQVAARGACPRSERSRTTKQSSRPCTKVLWGGIGASQVAVGTLSWLDIWTGCSRLPSSAAPKEGVISQPHATWGVAQCAMRQLVALMIGRSTGSRTSRMLVPVSVIAACHCPSQTGTCGEAGAPALLV
jgi:hypothetical protein